MIDSVNKEIDGVSYVIHQLGAKKGRAVLVRLTKVLGPSIGSLAKMDASAMGSAIAAAINDLAANVSENDLEWLCEVFGGSTEFTHPETKAFLRLTPDQQDLHFAGRYGHMLKWLAACLEVNFKDFFDMLSSAKGTPAFATLAPELVTDEAPPSQKGSIP